MRTEATPEGSVRYLDGNVWITQDTLSITSDNAVYYEAMGQLVFTGNVHFIEPTRLMWADQATYFEKDGHATAQGNVRIDQLRDSLVLHCDRAMYLEQRKEVNLIGNVRIHSLKEKAILTGGHGYYNRPIGHASMEQGPRLVRQFTEEDSMVVTGVLIEYFFDNKEAVVTKEVHIQRNDFDAKGDKLNYYREGDWAKLTGHPILQRRLDTMTADTVDSFFQDRELRRVHLSGKAVAISPVDSLAPQPVNVITGRQMDVIFTNGELDSIKVKGLATSLYYIRQPDGESGANRVSGDAIDLKISKGQVAWVFVVGSTEGIYFPRQFENLVTSDPTRSKASSQPAGQRP